MCTMIGCVRGNEMPSVPETSAHANFRSGRCCTNYGIPISVGFTTLIMVLSCLYQSISNARTTSCETAIGPHAMNDLALVASCSQGRY